MSEPSLHDHPDPDALRRFGLGEVSEVEAVAVEAHLGQCARCCQTLRGVGDDTLVELVRSAVRSPAENAQPGDSVRQATLSASVQTALSGTAPGPEGPALPPELHDHPRYRVLTLLGQGGMGAVYKAEHRLMARLVALKVIARGLTGKPEVVERFRREVRAAARLAHSNIVTAHDAEQAGETHFLVMEFVPGTDLAHWLRQHGPLPVAEACDYIRQAALGLQYAHEQGMTHRDLKPHNLMRTADGTIKILDFGLARFASEAGSLAGDAPTAQGMLLGTVDYMAPEQSDDARTADTRSDIYSLGCTLYHLLTGQPPFPTGTTLQKIRAHAATSPPPASERRPDLPAGLAAVFERLLAKDPAGRYQTPAAVAEALAPFSGRPAPPLGAAARPPARSRRRSLLAAGALLVAGLVVATGVVLALATNRDTVETRTGDKVEKTPGALPPRFENSLGMEFALVPRGKAWLGGGGGRMGHREVEIAHDFYLGVYAVTQEEWEKVTGLPRSHFSRTGSGKKAVKDIPNADLKRFPAENVSWDDAQLFLARVNARDRHAGWVYRLPTEKEREYACRNGPLSDRLDSAFNYYFDRPTNRLLPGQANFKHAKGLQRTCKVGSYPPNRLGLYDMHGNVWEWCASEGPAAPRDPKESSRRACRGGCWGNVPVDCRASSRSARLPSYRGTDLGLRLARVPVGMAGK